jgi:hypothetical protein
MNKKIAISSLRPGVEWTMVNDDVENIVWHTPDVEPLTEEEVLAKIAELETAHQNELDAKAAAKESAKAKLAALGLTEEEINAIKN